ncbi:J domain-containing protein [Geothrix fuzhouensis]|uniref:J domain-containing protein n=1 Tax=Geothrix fuzhouensis TaxID=2966451 RepID=UPI002147E18B|nr:DnaJ domain-containing protein [Geothrix fuzhouensis]
MNPFDVLELPPDASPEDIKAAYHRLAKHWHPDRYTGAAKVEAESKFRELAEAFSTLKDPGKRLALVQQIPKTATAAAAPREKERETEAPQERTPEDWAAMAKQAFDEGRVDQAQALIQYAIRLDDKKAQYHAMLATFLEQGGGDLRAAVKALEAAIRLSPRDVESHLRLAAHFQTLGMAARAQRHLQTAREIAPNHPKLRQPAPKSGKGGKAAPAPGKKGTASAAPEATASLVDQLKDLWGRLTGKG